MTYHAWLRLWKKLKKLGALLSQQRYVLFSETKISKLIIDRDRCVSLEVSEGVIPRTHAIQKASHMNIVLRFVCSDSLVTKRDEKNSWALLMEDFLLRREKISEWRAQRIAQDEELREAGASGGSAKSSQKKGEEGKGDDGELKIIEKVKINNSVEFLQLSLSKRQMIVQCLLVWVMTLISSNSWWRIRSFGPFYKRKRCPGKRATLPAEVTLASVYMRNMSTSLPEPRAAFSVLPMTTALGRALIVSLCQSCNNGAR